MWPPLQPIRVERCLAAKEFAMHEFPNRTHQTDERKFPHKLVLHKETLRLLTDQQLVQVAGGQASSIDRILETLSFTRVCL
jgi:hypothetical protein